VTAVEATRPDFPAPVGDLDSEPFWAAAAQQRLRVQVCVGCERGVFPPTPGRCPYCGLSLEWRYHELAASVYSWIGVEQAIYEWEAGLVPYSIVLARLDGLPDVRLPCLFAGPAAELKRHQTGSVRFGSEYGDGIRLLFEPAGDT
jgi:uncharacterized OB-fold protein